MALGSTQPLTEMIKGGRCVRLTNYHHPVPLSRNLRTLTSWNHLGHSRPVMGLLYLHVRRWILTGFSDGHATWYLWWQANNSWRIWKMRKRFFLSCPLRAEVISFYLRKPYTDNVDNEVSFCLLSDYSLVSSSLPLQSAQIRVHCASKCVPGVFSSGFKRAAASGEHSVSISYGPLPPYIQVVLLKHMDTLRFTFTYTTSTGTEE